MKNTHEYKKKKNLTKSSFIKPRLLYLKIFVNHQK